MEPLIATVSPPQTTCTDTRCPSPRRNSSRPRPRLRRFLLSLAPATWACLDAIVVALAAGAAQTLLLMYSLGYNWIAAPWLATSSFCVCITLAGLVFGLYERKTLLSRGAILLRSVLTLSVGVILTFACLSVLFYAAASRWVGLSVCLAYLGVALPLRLFAHEVVTTSRVRVLCVGAGDPVRRLVSILGSIHRPHYHVVGHVRVPEGVQALVAATVPADRQRFRADADVQFEQACPYVGTVGDIDAILEDHAVDEVVVGPEVAANPAVGTAVATCLQQRRRVTDQATFTEKLLGEVPAESINAEWFLRADVQNHGSYEAAKRLLDVVAASVGLLLSLPLWPIIALAIRLDGPGPIMFRQIRVGQHGRCFSMWKFRSMRPDAEKHGVRWAETNDQRVTGVGRFLRRSRLDELPQLINILRGDMSLVGPRPERPEFVNNLEQLLPHYRLRHLVKPGLSGWAQIHFRYGASVADSHRKLCYDLYYLKHRCLELDIAILIRTFGTFVLGSR